MNRTEVRWSRAHDYFEGGLEAAGTRVRPCPTVTLLSLGRRGAFRVAGKRRRKPWKQNRPFFLDRGYEGARGLLRVGRRQVGYLRAHPRNRGTRMVHTHAGTQVTGHDLPGSLSVRLPLVALLLDAVRRLPRSWPYSATESDGTGQWGVKTETQENLEQGLEMGLTPSQAVRPVEQVSVGYFGRY